MILATVWYLTDAVVLKRGLDPPVSDGRRPVFVDDDEKSEENYVETGAGAELIAGEQAFKPLLMISIWIERPKLTKLFSWRLSCHLESALVILLLQW